MRIVLALVVTLLAVPVQAQELFVSQRLTPPQDRYTGGIEGPAVDSANNLYVVNFQRPGTIGRVRAGQNRSEVFAVLPPGSIGSGIRFDRSGRMFVADYKKNNILVFDPGRRTARTYFHSPQFNQPNDLTIATDGTLYAGDPEPHGSHGRIWRVKPGANGTGAGIIMQARRMGRTNGIDLSPDGQTLYVGEANTREIWAYRIDGDRLVEPRLVKKFDDASEPDGLRTDIDGRIFVARQLSGKVTVLLPDGTVVREIQMRGQKPSNLTFGGPGGQTVYVTQVDGRFVEQFRTDRRGRETCASPNDAAC